eukprot:jgi/Mesen1/10653/ME000009S10447
MEPLSDAIEQALCELHQLDRTVSGFKESSQMLLFERMNNLVKALDNVQQVAGETDCHIPMEIFQFVDNGQNPDQYTREFLEGCIARNEATRGKVVAFRSLRKHLLEEIDAVFPEQADAYRSLRTASSKVEYLTRAKSSIEFNQWFSAASAGACSRNRSSKG